MIRIGGKVKKGSSMPWLTIKEFCAASGKSDSTVRRHIRRKSLLHRLENGQYLIFLEGTEPLAPATAAVAGGTGPEAATSLTRAGQVDLARIEEIVSFSSKALNSYLLMSDKLTQEKDCRLREKEEMIRELKQRVQELEKRLGQTAAAASGGEGLVP